jgi:hypothetical protein
MAQRSRVMEKSVHGDEDGGKPAVGKLAMVARNA